MGLLKIFWFLFCDIVSPSTAYSEWCRTPTMDEIREKYRKLHERDVITGGRLIPRYPDPKKLLN